MNIYKTLGLVACGLALAGCKTTINSEVLVSDLTGGNSKPIPATMYVELPSCNDFEDSRKPSKMLVDVQKRITEALPSAEYKDCFQRRMKSYAQFSTPLFLDLDVDGKLGSEDTINVISNDDVLLAAAAPDSVVRAVEAFKEKSPFGSAFALDVAFKITNDTKEPFRFAIDGAYLDGKPVLSSVMSAPPGVSFVLTLSNVAVDAALTGENGIALKVPPAKK